MRRFFWYTMPFVEYEDLWVYVECDEVLWSAMTPLECDATYAWREIPWEKDSGPQFPKFNNRADAGCCSLTGFQPIQQTSHTIYFETLSYFSLQNGKLTYQGTL